MPYKPTPSQARLKELFTYDPATGLFTRRIDTQRKRAGTIIKPMRSAPYHTIVVDGTTYMAHRLVWKFVTGEEPNVIDHINGRTRDNRIVNLRNVTVLENTWNRSRDTPNISGHVGVVPAFGGTVWRARIKLRNSTVFIGPFKTPQEASAARDQLMPLYRGQYHRTEDGHKK